MGERAGRGYPDLTWTEREVLRVKEVKNKKELGGGGKTESSREEEENEADSSLQ